MVDQGGASHRTAGPAWALHRLAVAGAAVDAGVAQRLGLSAPDFLALKHVLTAEGPLGPVELGRLLGMSSGSATALVDRLERSGHLLRRRHPTDRRRLVLAVTPSTRERVVAELEPLGEELEAIGEEFSAQEREAITRFLDLAVRQHLAHRSPPAPRRR